MLRLSGLLDRAVVESGEIGATANRSAWGCHATIGRDDGIALGWSALFLFVVDDESDDGADDNKEGDATDDERRIVGLLLLSGGGAGSSFGFFGSGFFVERDFGSFRSGGAVDFYFATSDVEFVAVAVDVLIRSVGVSQAGNVRIASEDELRRGVESDVDGLCGVGTVDNAHIEALVAKDEV